MRSWAPRIWLILEQHGENAGVSESKPPTGGFEFRARLVAAGRSRWMYNLLSTGEAFEPSKRWVCNCLMLLTRGRLFCAVVFLGEPPCWLAFKEKVKSILVGPCVEGHLQPALAGTYLAARLRRVRKPPARFNFQNSNGVAYHLG